MARWHCASCSELEGREVWHEQACPKLSEKRREQLRESQRRYRAKQREQKAAGTDKDSRIEKLRADVAKLKAEKRELQERISRLEGATGSATAAYHRVLGVAQGRRTAKQGIQRMLSVVHPDKQPAGCSDARLDEANRFTGVLNALRRELG